MPEQRRAKAMYHARGGVRALHDPADLVGDGREVVVAEDQRRPLPGVARRRVVERVATHGLDVHRDSPSAPARADGFRSLAR